MKTVRKAVRTFLIENNKVVAIKYTTNDYKEGFYDIPGGGIEEGEMPKETAIREFREETGMELINPQYAGNLVIEYPNRIFDMDIFIASDYNGTPQKFQENIAEWIDIDELLSKDKKFTEIYLLDEHHNYELLNRKNFKWHFLADINHNFLDEIYYSYGEKFWSEFSELDNEC